MTPQQGHPSQANGGWLMIPNGPPPPAPQMQMQLQHPQPAQMGYPNMQYMPMPQQGPSHAYAPMQPAQQPYPQQFPGQQFQGQLFPGQLFPGQPYPQMRPEQTFQATAPHQGPSAPSDYEQASRFWTNLDDDTRAKILRLYESNATQVQNANRIAGPSSVPIHGADMPTDEEPDTLGPSQPQMEISEPEAQEDEDYVFDDSAPRGTPPGSPGMGRSSKGKDVPRSTERPGNGTEDSDTPTTPNVSTAFGSMLLDKWHQMNEILHEREAANREFQEHLLESFKQLGKKLSRVQHVSPLVAQTHARQAVKSNSRPARGMASRIVLQSDANTTNSPNAPRPTAAQLEAAKAMEKTYLTRLQKVVRLHFAQLVGFTGKDYKKMAQLNPPLTDKDLETYDADPALNYFESHRFQVDFTRSWKSCAFNVEARDHFVQHLLRALKGGAYRTTDHQFPARYVNAWHIGQALDTYMDTCHERYKDSVNPPAAEKLDKRAQRTRQNARRNTVRCIAPWRVKRLLIFIQHFMSRRVTLSEEELQHHLELMSLLRAENMSDDETDRDEVTKAKKYPAVFYIRDAEWMSAIFREFLRSVDALKLRKLKPGNSPRLRLARKKTTKYAQAAVPEGLWRNCYNIAWLSTLKTFELRKLRIIDEDYDFTLPSCTVEKKGSGDGNSEGEGEGDGEGEGEDEDEDEDEEMVFLQGSSGQ
ncbi:hypothetical protein TRAPUB_6891 [Trametes pubescens]|uniref:Uncharacterized protein n=1 Tax=Trametes pubescens TaxID=154538 RepID=A0A1M2V4M6_TRAPU|nr:hypothetical protein TRAPUB_6891 [Trametes pubescens]